MAELSADPQTTRRVSVDPMNWFRQNWPAVVAAYEAAVIGVVLFDFWAAPDPEQLAFVIGVPATLAGLLGVTTHASVTVLEQLAAVEDPEV